MSARDDRRREAVIAGSAIDITVSDGSSPPLGKHCERGDPDQPRRTKQHEIEIDCCRRQRRRARHTGAGDGGRWGQRRGRWPRSSTARGSGRDDAAGGALERKRPADGDQLECAGGYRRRSALGRRHAVWLRNTQGRPADGWTADGQHARRRLQQRQPGCDQRRSQRRRQQRQHHPEQHPDANRQRRRGDRRRRTRTGARQRPEVRDRPAGRIIGERQPDCRQRQLAEQYRR